MGCKNQPASRSSHTPGPETTGPGLRGGRAEVPGRTPRCCRAAARGLRPVLRPVHPPVSGPQARRPLSFLHQHCGFSTLVRKASILKEKRCTGGFGKEPLASAASGHPTLRSLGQAASTRRTSLSQDRVPLPGQAVLSLGDGENAPTSRERRGREVAPWSPRSSVPPLPACP